jgi:leader peptidase (prepilin peptidase)/N-methyltransferase
MDGLGVMALGVLVLLLIPVVAVDLRERRIPDPCNLALAACGLAYAALRQPDALAWTLVQAGLAAGLVALAGRFARGLGGGDAKFMVAASLWVGLEGVALVLLLAGLALLAEAGARRALAGAGWTQARPFGPMLAGALLATAALFELAR